MLSDPQQYSKIVRRYTGHGQATIPAQLEVNNSAYELIQYATGRIYLRCSIRTTEPVVHQFDDTCRHCQAQSLEEATTRGVLGQYSGTSPGGRLLVQKMYLASASRHHTADPTFTVLNWIFICEEAVLESLSPTQPEQVHFALANLEYSDGSWESAPALRNYQRRPPPLEEIQRPLNLDGTSVSIKLVPDYDDILDALMATQGVDITCTAIVPLHAADELATIERRMDNLCLLLTLARGTQVDWINYEAVSAAGDTIYTKCRNNGIVKRFERHHLLAPYPITINTLRLEAAYPRVEPARENWDIEQVIAVYTDAKVEGDRLSSKGLKAVVCIEILCDRFKARKDVTQTRLITRATTKQLRRALKMQLRELLLQEGRAEEEVTTLVEDLALGLDDYPLKQVIFNVLDEIGGTYGDRITDVPKFVKIRNMLVHQGRFPNEYGPPTEQYQFLIAFVGKVLSRILFWIETQGVRYDLS